MSAIETVDNLKTWIAQRQQSDITNYPAAMKTRYIYRDEAFKSASTNKKTARGMQILPSMLGDQSYIKVKRAEHYTMAHKCSDGSSDAQNMDAH